MEKKNGIMFFYGVAEWVMLLAYVNILWIVFTVLGLFVLGVFPSTAGVYTVVRKWITHGNGIPVWKTFWQSYRKEFVKANTAGYLFVIIGGIIYIDLKFFQHLGGLFPTLISYLFILAFIIYMVLWLFFFPVFVHYDLKIFQYIKQTFLIVILRPLEAILSMACGLVVYYLMMHLPGLIPFFGVSVLALLTMLVASRAFNKLQIKIENRGIEK